MKVDFYQKAKEAEEEIKRYYIHLHKHPELSGQEYQTQEWILSQLKQWGVECRTCADTGVYAIIRSEKPGYTIAFRADMDALPIQEQTGLSWSSEENGVMHACGHDAHMTVLLGCIRILHENREQLYGNIVFLFQPSEEHQGGAARMIVDGAMKTPKPDLIVAFHVWPQRAGTITCMSGPVMAQPDAFSIELIGKGGHGATPHICRNPIPAMAALINAIGNITANDISARKQQL
ncbi:M20 metallopeptidase family protein [Blautia sp. LMAG:36]|uniref:M20 metallopeptidase family protein n=1 Tax=Blautia sp. LMAG:36 TaxID=1969168 RepID=UPI002579E919|nr:M20 family metallopeptidase [Blautia sp. LMAG:36]